MPTQEDRLAALERKIASIELEMLYEQRKAEEIAPSEQAYNLKEINHHLTMLLGIASGQERDIKIVKSDLGIIKDRMEGFEQRFTSLDDQVSSLDGKVTSLDEKVTSLEETVEQRFTSLEGKLEQVLHILTNLPGTDK